MWHGMEGIGWGWIGIGFLHMVLFWAIVILALGGMVRWLTGKSPGAASALDILKARYARGDLTREEFETMKRDLGEQGN
jgi:putative membrane protein